MSCFNCHFLRFDREVNAWLCGAGEGDTCLASTLHDLEVVTGETVRPCHGCGYDLDGIGPECPQCGVVNEWAYTNKRSAE